MYNQVTKKEHGLIDFAGSKTESVLEKAFNGDIPAAALKSMDLDKKMVSGMIAKELLILHYAAAGAKMDLVALLFCELHAAMIGKA
jgi:hypothetical protein